MNRLKEPVRHLDPDSGSPLELREMLQAACDEAPNRAQIARMTKNLFSHTQQVSQSSSAPSSIRTSYLARIGIALAVAAAGVWVIERGWYDRVPPESPKSQQQQKLSGSTKEASEPAHPPGQPLSLPDTSDDPSDTLLQLPEEGPDRAISHRIKKQPRSAPAKSWNPDQELLLLKEAKRSLPKAASRAFRFTERHRLSYPQGIYQQEREAIAIEALLRIGYKSRAEKRAQRFYERFPNSAYKHRIRQLFHQKK